MSPHPSARHAPATPIRVLLCDGIAIRRAVVRDFLEQDGEIVVGEIAGPVDDAPRAERVQPDVVITTAPELQSGEPVLPADVCRVAPSAAVLVLGVRDDRRVAADGVVELPRSTSLAQLRNEVIAAAATTAVGTRPIPLLNRPMKRA